MLITTTGRGYREAANAAKDVRCAAMRDSGGASTTRRSALAAGVFHSHPSAEDRLSPLSTSSTSMPRLDSDRWRHQRGPR